MLLQPATEQCQLLHASHARLCICAAYGDAQLACCALLHRCAPTAAGLQQAAYSLWITAD
jgi:hypothetical protein